VRNHLSNTPVIIDKPVEMVLRPQGATTVKAPYKKREETIIDAEKYNTYIIIKFLISVILISSVFIGSPHAGCERITDALALRKLDAMSTVLQLSNAFAAKGNFCPNIWQEIQR